MDSEQYTLSVNDLEPSRSGETRDLDLLEAVEYDALCQRSAGRKAATIEQTGLALRKLYGFLCRHDLPRQIGTITPGTIRLEILELAKSLRFTGHRYTPEQKSALTSGAINNFLRAQRAAFNRWEADGLISASPFRHVKLPVTLTFISHWKWRSLISMNLMKMILSI